MTFVTLSVVQFPINKIIRIYNFGILWPAKQMIMVFFKFLLFLLLLTMFKGYKMQKAYLLNVENKDSSHNGKCTENTVG